jgi:HNH endonuclease
MIYRRFRNRPDCGTRSGYDYHVRTLFEWPCEPCREANKIYFKEARVAGKLKKLENRKNRNQKISWLEVLKLHGDICYLCSYQIDLQAPRQVGKPGWEMSFHPDHVIPLSRGGTDTLDNMKPAHAICNQRKSNKLIGERND